MEQPRFLVDAMLGRLARWLRVLGFDTVYDAAASDQALVRQAADEHRILLTRDRHLLREWQPPRALAIEQEAPLDQLRAVVGALGLSAPPGLFTRCVLCNQPLELVPEVERPSLVPTASQSIAGLVQRCSQCGRVYWYGSHVRRMRHALEEALPGWLDGAG